PGDRAQRRQMLDRLMGRTVFAVAHRVVCENKYGREFHQSREPDRWPRIVAENEERRPESSELGEREPVHRCGHRMLADAEMQIFPCPVISLEVSRALEGQSGLVRRAKIGRASKHPRNMLSENVQHFA